MANYFQITALCFPSTFFFYCTSYLWMTPLLPSPSLQPKHLIKLEPLFLEYSFLTEWLFHDLISSLGLHSWWDGIQFPDHVLLELPQPSVLISLSYSLIYPRVHSFCYLKFPHSPCFSTPLCFNHTDPSGD